jgi:hypothetical protein
LQTGKIVVPVLRQTCDYHNLNLLCAPVDFRFDTASGTQQLIQTFKAPAAVQQQVN